MNRLSKAILIALVALVVVVVAAVVGVNLYIQSPTVQLRIQSELSKALRLPLQITSTTVTPWGGLQMSGISVPQQGGTQIEAKSFHADYRLFPLLRGELVLSTMILDGPRIVWAQNADGEWRLPGLPDTHQPKAAATTPREPKEKPSRISVDTMEIKNGAIQLIDSTHARVGFADGVAITYSIGEAGRATGTLTAAHLTWQDALNFSDVRGLFTYEDGKLTFTDLHGAIAGGTASGAITIQTSDKVTPYEAALDFDHVDLARLTAEANWQPGQSAGLLSGKVKLHGTTQKFDASEGGGHLTLADGQFNQLQLFQMIGLVLQIPELSDLRFKTSEIDFRVANQHTFVDHLLLATPNLQFSAAGNIRFDGRIAINARLGVSQKLASELPTLVTASLTPPDQSGLRAIDFEITGRTDKPRTNLREKVFSQKNVTSQLDDLLSAVFGGDSGAKKKKDKKKDDTTKGSADPAKPASKKGSATAPGPASPTPTPPAPAAPADTPVSSSAVPESTPPASPPSPTKAPAAEP